jgi:hypothetical protein
VNPETHFHDHEPPPQWASLRVLFLRGAGKSSFFEDAPAKMPIAGAVNDFCDRETGFLGSRLRKPIEFRFYCWIFCPIFTQSCSKKEARISVFSGATETFFEFPLFAVFKIDFVAI